MTRALQKVCIFVEMNLPVSFYSTEERSLRAAAENPAMKNGQASCTLSGQPAKGRWQ